MNTAPQKFTSWGHECLYKWKSLSAKRFNRCHVGADVGWGALGCFCQWWCQRCGFLAEKRSVWRTWRTLALPLGLEHIQRQFLSPLRYQFRGPLRHNHTLGENMSSTCSEWTFAYYQCLRRNMKPWIFYNLCEIIRRRWKYINNRQILE